MNTRIITTSVRTTSIRRTVFTCLVTTLLLLAATFGQVALEQTLGVNLTTPAHACQGSGGGGSC